MKIVWLCHFINQEMKNYFNKPNLNEIAPWIDILINDFKEDKTIDLHIVAPNIYTNRDISFTKDGIFYHFYNYYSRCYTRKIYSLKRIIFPKDYFLIKLKVAGIIKKINPDLIHLHGAENPYYSATILLLLTKYPVLLTIQGFIRNSLIENREIKAIIQIEEEIIRKVKNFGTRVSHINNVVKGINPNANFFFHNYPFRLPKFVKQNHGDKEPFDCIFFARVCKDKGIEDLLSAISIIKKKYSSISLLVIGSTGKMYFKYLEKKCLELDIKNNVRFLGFLTQEEIYRFAVNSKISVLPTYHDIMPGTIIESMYMKLPVVAYNVDGISELNAKGQIVILVKKSNIDELANSIIHLLENPELRISLAEKAYLTVRDRFDNSRVKPDILKAYNKILNNSESISD